MEEMEEQVVDLCDQLERLAEKIGYRIVAIPMKEKGKIILSYTTEEVGFVRSMIAHRQYVLPKNGKDENGQYTSIVTVYGNMERLKTWIHIMYSAHDAVEKQLQS